VCSSDLTVRGIEYYPSVTILGITFWGTIEQMTEAIRLFERASGACVNPQKSKELEVGGWRAKRPSAESNTTRLSLS
jgi:hypothetical protein